ncbi:YqjF family protein [Halosimplex aquaticum]|uniref:YqjF family protein n=1 Tax=Halosimplex aquaticum TaxID=3026162 RepID=A0ABD5Y7M5_9EURY|nr:DUF2071 domain-containing protein [Halosimplex aquaticum]
MSLTSGFSVPIAMGWRDLLFANWPVDPAVLDPHVPDDLDLDTYEGDAWLSVVPFVNVNVRPRGAPSALGIRLPELNLRTYVRAGDDPGIYFFTLDAQGVLSVLGARVTHHLPYHYARMDVSRSRNWERWRRERQNRAERGVDEAGPGESSAASGARSSSGAATGGPSDEVYFASTRRHPGSRPCRFAASYRPTGERFRAERGSLARFLTERHLLYTQDQRGRLRYTRARHPPWPLCDAAAEIDRNELFEAHGFDYPERDPVHYYSPGVDTVTSASRAVEDATAPLLRADQRV